MSDSPSPRAAFDPAALTAPFKPGEVKFKPQSVKGNRALALAYIDCRVIQDRLDDVLGVENWSDEYEILTDGSVMCRLKLRLNGEWVTKVDVGSPSEQPDGGDRLKAAFSDAMKRTAIKFGIGRYLYRLPAVWCDYDPQKRQFSGTPQLPAWAIPAGTRQATQPQQPNRDQRPIPQQQPAAKPAGQFATTDALLAAMRQKDVPTNGVSLAERVKWCDHELARLMGQGFRAGSLIAAVLDSAKVATFQQLTALQPGEMIGRLWHFALTHCQTATAPKAQLAAPTNLAGLLDALRRVDAPESATHLVQLVTRADQQCAALAPQGLKYKPGGLAEAVRLFAKVDTVAHLADLEHAKDWRSAWQNAIQYVAAMTDHATRLAKGDKSHGY